jgi:hypothetical protein
LAYGTGVNRLPTLALSVLIAALPACGGSSPPAQAPEAAAASTSGAPAAEPEAAKPAPAAEASPTETLARDLVKAGGRRIGYSAGKKRFVVPVEMRTDSGRGLDLRFYDDEGAQREIQRVCQPGECEERLDEIVKELLPKLAARLDKEGFEAVYSIGWPSGRDEIEVGALGGKLRYEQGRLSLARDKKAPAQLRALRGKAPRGAGLSAVYPVPAAKLLGALFEQDFVVFKLP